MPKPLKKPARTLKTPTKPLKRRSTDPNRAAHAILADQRPTDPNRAAHAILADHMSRIQDEPTLAPEPPLDFAAQYKAHMSKLGAKGGRASGAKRKFYAAS